MCNQKHQALFLALLAFLLPSVLKADNVAKVGDVGYKTLREAIQTAAETTTNIVVDLTADATLDITAWDGTENPLSIGTVNTESITINGNSHTLTFNQKDSDWNNVATKNDAVTKLTLNDMAITSSGYNSGHWKRNNLFFSCKVEMNNVTSTALGFKNDATLNNVTIVDNRSDIYGIWIMTNGNNVAINGLTLNTKGNGGRGIAIKDEDSQKKDGTSLEITNVTFSTDKKAAIIVTSDYTVNINAGENINIDNVAADNTNLVWVDEDRANEYYKVTVEGAKLAPEGGEGKYVASLVRGEQTRGYYDTLAAAYASTDFAEGDSYKLHQATTEAVEIAKVLTIVKNGFTAANVSAAEGYKKTETDEEIVIAEFHPVCEIANVKYETLEEAFAAVQGGETITLLSDVTLADEMVLALEGKAITLNLNGKTLNGRTNLTSGNLTIRNGNVTLEGGQPLNVYGSATAGAENYSVLTIADDVKVSGTYGVCMFGPTASSKAGYGAVINVAGEVSGTDGTIFVSGNLGNNIEGDMNNVVNITGKVIGNDNAGVALNGNATVNVKNGAEITGNTAIAIKRGTLNVEDRATVHATGEKNLEPEANNNGTEMTGAAISMTDTYNKYGAMSVNITGGSIMSDNAPALFKKEGSYSNEASFTVSGGTFSSEVPEEFCSDGFIPTDMGNGKYGVKEGSYVAQVDDAKYETLAEAVEAAQGTSVVTLLADVAETYTMSENETLKIKKNGFKFEVAAPEGDFKVETEEADGVTTYTVVALSMEEKDIVLVDGEPYTVTADTQVKSATYTRDYAADRVGKFQAWSMPFDYTITEEAAGKFTFYRINMIAHSADRTEEVESTDKLWVYVAPMKAGEKLTANRPYAYKPKAEGEFTFAADNNKLYAPDYTSRLHTETVDHSYDFFGTYNTVSMANQGGDFYYLNADGEISHATEKTVKVGSYRWIVKATSKNGANYAPRFIFVEEGAETEGIRSICGNDDVEGFYTLGGTRVETPHHGMFVVKYKNGNIKKQFIK